MAWDFSRFDNPHERRFGQGGGGGSGTPGQGFGRISNQGGYFKKPNLMQQIFERLAKHRENYRQPGAVPSAGLTGGSSRCQVMSRGSNFIVELLSSLAQRGRN